MKSSLTFSYMTDAIHQKNPVDSIFLIHLAFNHFLLPIPFHFSPVHCCSYSPTPLTSVFALTQLSEGFA